MRLISHVLHPVDIGVDCLMEMQISLPKNNYVPGDIIEGTVIFKCDKKTLIKEAIITLASAIFYHSAEMKRKGGSYGPALNIGSLPNHTDKFQLTYNTEFDVGTYELPFQFFLPKDIVPTFYSSKFQSIYFLHCSLSEAKNAWANTMAKLAPTISKKPTVRIDNQLTILAPLDKTLGESVEALSDLPHGALKIKVESNAFCLGKKILFWYKIDPDMKFNDFKIELEITEHWKSMQQPGKGEKNTYTRTVETIRSERIIPGEWSRIEFSVPKGTPPSFVARNFESSISMKISLARRFNTDCIAKLPLILGHCLEQN